VSACGSGVTGGIARTIYRSTAIANGSKRKRCPVAIFYSAPVRVYQVAFGRGRSNRISSARSLAASISPSERRWRMATPPGLMRERCCEQPRRRQPPSPAPANRMDPRVSRPMQDIDFYHPSELRGGIGDPVQVVVSHGAYPCHGPSGISIAPAFLTAAALIAALAGR
jgi:hypothetical protein